MKDVRVPHVEVVVSIESGEVARFDFYRIDRHPQDWEVTAVIRDPDSKSAIRACLLACMSELDLGHWEHYIIEAESTGGADDQLQLPWS